MPIPLNADVDWGMTELTKPVKLSSDEGWDDAEQSLRRVMIFEVDTVFAAAARQLLKVEDKSAPVAITEIRDKVGDSTIEAYTSVTIWCAGFEYAMHDQMSMVGNPMAVMIRMLESQGHEAPRKTVERLLGRDPDGNNIKNLPVLIHRLGGDPIAGKIQWTNYSAVWLHSETG